LALHTITLRKEDEVFLRKNHVKNHHIKYQDILPLLYLDHDQQGTGAGDSVSQVDPAYQEKFWAVRRPESQLKTQDFVSQVSKVAKSQKSKISRYKQNQTQEVISNPYAEEDLKVEKAPLEYDILSKMGINKTRDLIESDVKSFRSNARILTARRGKRKTKDH